MSAVTDNYDKIYIFRDGHTATFLPDTGEIIYIGDTLSKQLLDTTIFTVTNNPPERRYGHTAVLIKDKRIIVFGGSLNDLNISVDENTI
ncbi:hypothetical protein C1645_835972 [Glomus cerebriforme]|uniref:Uncharacterized protein n=1 Tax=Glomus cerebriforme TaxID=658196 RepID=A0A397S966_9GLOM|nr:hypothetical protein C1645_835972 [Glomus cerebriforme]